MKIELIEGTDYKFMLDGNTLVEYDINKNTLNKEFYGGDHSENVTFYLELLIDRTIVEVFADHGEFSIIAPLAVPKSNNGFEFVTGGSNIKIHDIEIHEMKSTW